MLNGVLTICSSLLLTFKYKLFILIVIVIGIDSDAGIIEPKVK